MPSINDQAVRERIMERIDLEHDIGDEELLRIIREEICVLGQTVPLPVPKRIRLEKEIYNSLRKLDILQELLEDDEITEIMINGPDAIFIERKGTLYRTEKRFSSAEKLSDVIQQIVAWNNQVVNETTPIVDTRLPDGSRVNIVLPPVAVDHSVLSIRRFPKEVMTMEMLLKNRSIDEAVAAFIGTAVQRGYNIFVSGSTGAGKTTLLNVLSEFIPKDERVVTIEDSAELQLHGIANLVRLEARNANLEGKHEVTIRDLVRNALRMRPDRIIVGECRGAEALDILQANNTGHDGSLSTGHANSARDMVSRLETMVLMGAMELPLPAIRRQIASGIDLFIHVSRQPDRSRKIVEVSEVRGMEDGDVKLSTLYAYERETDSWVKKHPLENTEKWEKNA